MLEERRDSGKYTANIVARSLCVGTEENCPACAEIPRNDTFEMTSWCRKY